MALGNRWERHKEGSKAFHQYLLVDTKSRDLVGIDEVETCLEGNDAAPS